MKIIIVQTKAILNPGNPSSTLNRKRIICLCWSDLWSFIIANMYYGFHRVLAFMRDRQGQDLVKLIKLTREVRISCCKFDERGPNLPGIGRMNSLYYHLRLGEKKSMIEKLDLMGFFGEEVATTFKSYFDYLILNSIKP